MSKNLKVLMLTTLVITAANMQSVLGAEHNSILKDTYIAVGMGKAFPHGKISSFTFQADSLGKDYYAKKKLKDSNIYRAAVGKGFNYVRAEFEFLHSEKHKFNNSYPYTAEITGNYKFHTSHNAYFLNAYYDFKKLHEKIVPYIGLGVGVSQNTVSKKILALDGVDTISWEKKRSKQFAYNASLGVIFNINKTFYADFSYKFIDLGKLKSNSDGKEVFTGVPTPSSPQVTGRFKANVLLFSIGAKF